MTDIEDHLESLRESGLYRKLRVISGPQGPRVLLDGKPVLLLCSNNYLGLADHPRVREAAAEGAMVEFERVAVTEEQVRTFHLPTAPAKASDHRSFTGTTTQAEALAPDVLAAIVHAGVRYDLEVDTTGADPRRCAEDIAAHLRR